MNQKDSRMSNCLRVGLLLLVGLISLKCVNQKHTEEIKLMTFNIRYDNPSDGINNWETRKLEVSNLILSIDPHFLGIQEGRDHQVGFLQNKMHEYSTIGISREGIGITGEFCSIFYKHHIYELIEAKTFWLSPSPDKPSIGWDAAYKRICTYGLFKHHKLDHKILVFNTHFDHMGEEARKQSVHLIHAKISELNSNGNPVILMGDLNAEPTSEPIRYLKDHYCESQQFAKSVISGPIGTFNGFDPDNSVERKIDYIFTKNLNINEYGHVDVQLNDSMFISDHLPVLTIASFQ